MKRLFSTAALLGMLTLGGLYGLPSGQADESANPVHQRSEASSAVDLVQAPHGPHAQAITELLAASAGPDRDAAVADFRELGPDGFDALLRAIQPAIQQYRAGKYLGSMAGTHQAEALVRLLDRVAGQRDAYTAGLYWYTDLDAAKARAQETGKPILSLRMLGNLDEEYSCANSRFFRTALYADAKLSEQLRNNFVLHWHSVRPVPVITIDMGDGRVIRRTITGNSCHIAMDATGRVMDVIPGLYGPRTFEQQITQLHELAGPLSSLGDAERDAALRAYHQRAGERLDARWAELTESHELGSTPSPLGLPAEVDEANPTLPEALEAAVVARGKGMIERPVLLAIDTGHLTVVSPPQQATDEFWNHVAQAYADGATLDLASRRLIREKTISAEQAARMAWSKSRVEDPLLAMVRNFEGAIALDTARNEHLLHREIHRWFVNGEVQIDDSDALTGRVYADLFLTPDQDPWLGLVPADTYSALDAGGLEVCETPR
ncbi:MAG: hypothetical protein AAGH88_09680 [Planctomycetota bacterium]